MVANANRTIMNGPGLDPSMIDLHAISGPVENDPALAYPLPASTPAGAVIGTIRDPLPGRGIATFATSGTVPPQLALGTRLPAGCVQIVRGSTALVVGTTYAIAVEATSADGERITRGIVRFLAM